VETAGFRPEWPLAGKRASIVLQAAALAGDNINSRLSGELLNSWTPAASARPWNAARPETLPWCTVPCHARRPASQYRGPWSHGCCHELITNIANIVLPLLQFHFKRARERERGITLFAIAQ